MPRCPRDWAPCLTSSGCLRVQTFRNDQIAQNEDMKSEVMCANTSSDTEWAGS